MPKSLPFAPFSTSIDRMTAASVSTPSTERSIEPIRMMKVAPRPRTSGIIAAWLMRTKLPKVRKFGLIAAMMRAQQHEHDHRRPRGDAPAADALDRLARRPAPGSRSSVPEPSPRRTPSIVTRQRPRQPRRGAARAERRGRAQPARAACASCTGSGRWRGPRCRSSRACGSALML